MKPEVDTQMLMLYEEAMDRLPPLSRVVFLLHRVDELSYVEIAERLSITVAVVEACIVEALLVICATVDGREHRQRPREAIAEVEAVLRERHRRACGDLLRESGGGVWRMLHSIRHIGRRRPTFEKWLCSLAGRTVPANQS